MYKGIIQKIRPEADKVVEFFTKEALKFRTGQASPALVEDIMVEAYGQKMPIKQLAAISCPERRQILIQPWDKSSMEAIQKALLTQDSLGTSPIADKDSLRINLPPLTQEFREKILKILADKEEEAKQVIRKLRDLAWGEVQEKTRTGQIREDDKFKGKEDLQKLVDEYNKKIEDVVARKQREIKET